MKQSKIIQKGLVILSTTMVIIATSCDGLHLNADVAGHKIVDAGPKENSKYSYTENGCATGEVTYTNGDELCQALKDDARNQHCAQSMRYDRFKQDCAGQSWN